MRPVARGLAIALGIVAVGAAPYAVAIAVIGREFNLGGLAIYVPQRQFRPLSSYFIDDFAWGRTWQGLSVEIGRFLIVALIVLGVVVLRQRARLRAPTFVFLAASTIVYFWFQMPVAAAFFTAVPISQILQFPWRLLAFITPLVILMVAALAQAASSLRGVSAQVAVAVLAGTWAAQAQFATVAHQAAYDWIRPQDLAALLADLDGPFAAGEFLPRRLAGRAAPPRTPLFRFDGCTLVSSGVELARLERVPFETIELKLESTRGCTIHFNQFSTTLVSVRPSAGGRVARADDETTDVILPAGASAVRIERRGVFRALAAAVAASGTSPR